MTMYDNPISDRDNTILAFVQRAAARVAILHQEGIDTTEALRHWRIVDDFARYVLNGKHERALEDARYGWYDSGDRVVPVWPRDIGIPAWARAVSDEKGC